MPIVAGGGRSNSTPTGLVWAVDRPVLSLTGFLLKGMVRMRITRIRHRRVAGARDSRGFIALLLALLLVVAACGDGSGDAGGDDTGGDDGVEEPTDQTLIVSHPQEPPNWNWVDSASTAIRALLVLNVVEPLLELQEDGSVAPLLAEEFDVDDEGLVYTFTIREATFHDGSELSAADVVYSLEFNRSSEQGALAAVFEPVESIVAVDDRTVQITLSRPSQNFLAGMAKDTGLIIPEGSSDSVPQGPIGTGPFVFTNWRPGTNVELERFEDYWGDLPTFADVDYRFIGDETAAVNALLAGDVDVVAVIAGEGIERVNSVRETDGFDATTHSTLEFTYLSINATNPKYDDERIRQAIAHAIDRQPIFDAAFAGLGAPNCVFANPMGQVWDSDHCPYPYDPDRSRELLAEAGAEGMEINFKFLTVAEFPPIMEVVTSQLEDVGFQVTTIGRELTTYLDEVLGDAHDYEFTSLSGPQQIDAWIDGGWFTLYADEEFDDLIQAADRATDTDEWADLRRQAIERYADAAYLIPVGNKEGVALHRDDLIGIKPFRPVSEFDMRRLSFGS
jgi:peptide/nickel transport system substrate-binding protein